MEKSLTTKRWEKKCKERGHRFTTIRTTKAVFDRIAVLSDSEHGLTVEWTNGKGKIHGESIPKDGVLEVRYYQN